MKIKKIIAALVMSSTFGCTAQSSQYRPIAPFNQVVISGGITVLFQQVDSAQLSIKGDDSDVQKVETEVKNGILNIGSKGHVTGDVLVYLGNPSLTSITISGASELRTQKPVKTEKLAISVSGSSEIKMQLESKVIDCQQSGASQIKISGKTDTLRADISGASSFACYELQSDVVKITTSGASSARVRGNKSVRASATGASEIRIKGNPAELSAEAGTSSSILRISDGINSKNLSDTTVYNFKKRRIIIIGKEEEEEETAAIPSLKHWHGFSLGLNGWTEKSVATTLSEDKKYMDLDYSRSFNYQCNLIERQFNLASDYLKIITGFGFDYHSYALSNKTNLNPDSSFTFGSSEKDGSKDFKKNKFRATYIQIPLLLECNTSKDPNKTIHLAAGIIGQYLISSRTKQVYEQNGNTQKKIKRDNYNLSPLAAKAHVNIGYGNLTVFGEYSLTSLFQKGKGPELYPFVIGFRLINFG